MCIFTGSVHDVSSTAIFARQTDNSRQVLVYSMALVASADVAMVLDQEFYRGSFSLQRAPCRSRGRIL